MGIFANVVGDGVSWEGLFETFASLPEFEDPQTRSLCLMNQEITKQLYSQTRFKLFDPTNPEAGIK